MDDGGEVPEAILFEPSDDCETLGNVAVEVGLIARFPAGSSIEVEDKIGRACDVLAFS
jgi:hypothetical protein